MIQLLWRGCYDTELIATTLCVGKKAELFWKTMLALDLSGPIGVSSVENGLENNRIDNVCLSLLKMCIILFRGCYIQELGPEGPY